jgi:hypothetical protein
VFLIIKKGMENFLLSLLDFIGFLALAVDCCELLNVMGVKDVFKLTVWV